MVCVFLGSKYAAIQPFYVGTFIAILNERSKYENKEN